MSLKEIFAIMRKNRRVGVELIYNSYYNKMYGIAFSIVKNETITEDIVHNVCYKFLTMKEDLFPNSHEATWLYSVIKNESLMILRKGKMYLPLEKIKGICLEDKNINDYVDMDAYYSIIKPLNDTQKTIITLKVLGGFTHKEIAAMINKPIGTVQWLYNTSIKKLKMILSSLISVLAIVFIVTVAEGILYYQNLSISNDSSLGANNFYIDYLFITLIILLSLITSGLIIFIKKSYKIPTKATKKLI